MYCFVQLCIAICEAQPHFRMTSLVSTRWNSVVCLHTGALDLSTHYGMAACTDMATIDTHRHTIIIPNSAGSTHKCTTKVLNWMLQTQKTPYLYIQSYIGSWWATIPRFLIFFLRSGHECVRPTPGRDIQPIPYAIPCTREVCATLLPRHMVYK